MRIMKKTGKILLILITIIAVTIISLIAINKIKKSDYDNLPKNDKLVLEEIGKIYKEKPEKIWTYDYDFSQIPIILTPVKKDRGMWHTYSYAINVDNIENSIYAKKVENLEHLGLKDVYRISSFTPFTLMEYAPINFLFVQNNKQKVFCFKYNPTSIENINNLSGFQYFMIHEAFHEFRQLPVWKNVLPGDEIQRAYDEGNIQKAEQMRTTISLKGYNKEIIQRIICENLILDKALKSHNEKEIKNYMTDWAKLRLYRNKKYPITIEENKVETLEGSAHYIEKSYERSLGKDYEYALSSQNNKYMFKDLFTNEKIVDNMIKSGYIYSLLSKNLYYYTGATLGLICDKLHINWKTPVENSEYLADVIISKLNIDHKQITEEQIDKILKAYDYDSYENIANEIYNSIK